MSDNITENASGAQPKMNAQDALKALVESVRMLQGKLESETKARKAFEAETSQTITRLIRDNDQLTERLAKTNESLFITLSIHMDLVSPMRSHSDPEVAAEAEQQINFALKQQATIDPELYMRVYGVDPATGEVLPGRTVGVPLEPGQELEQTGRTRP